MGGFHSGAVSVRKTYFDSRILTSTSNLIWRPIGGCQNTNQTVFWRHQISCRVRQKNLTASPTWKPLVGWSLVRQKLQPQGVHSHKHLSCLYWPLERTLAKERRITGGVACPIKRTGTTAQFRNQLRAHRSQKDCHMLQGYHLFSSTIGNFTLALPP